MGLDYLEIFEEEEEEKVKQMVSNSTDKLINLVKENPDLPIVFMVSHDEYEHDGSRIYLEEYSDIRVDAYLSYNETFYFKRDEEDLFDDFYDQNYEEMNKQFNNHLIGQMTKFIADLFNDKWIKAIIIYV